MHSPSRSPLLTPVNTWEAFTAALGQQFLPSLRPAATQTMPAVQPGVGTLQEALNRAPDGGELVLADGTYRGSGRHYLLTISKSITIRALHAGQAVLDGEEMRCVVQISKHKHRRVELDGLKITRGKGQNNGNGQGGGIFQSGGRLTLTNCEICNNEANEKYAQGGAVFALDGATLVVSNCRIHSNAAHNGRHNQGAGIWLMNSTLTMSGSTLHDNKADQGAALFIHQSTATLDEGCRVNGSIHGQYTTVDHISPVVFADVISDKDVGLVTTTDASRVGSFKLVLATEPSQALAKGHQYDIDDQSNMYGASTKLTDLRAAATFCFAADHEHVSLEADRYLCLAVNCAQFVEGGSCCLLRSKEQPEGGSGCPWKINSDGTLSPNGGKNLVLGFGPITYDSWNRREQTADSIGGANFVAIGLVAPGSAHRLIVHRTGKMKKAPRGHTRPANPATAATDDELATTPPSAMSMERGHVISSKSMHGCSCEVGMLWYNWMLTYPGISCISPHPSAPDSEDVFARWACVGTPPLCCLVTNERWERVGDNSNGFRRTEGRQVPQICAQDEAKRTHTVSRCCGCCLCHHYWPLPTGCNVGLQPTSCHGILCPGQEGVNTDHLPGRGPGGGGAGGGGPGGGNQAEPHNHMGHNMHNPAPDGQMMQSMGQYA